ncbi:MAG: hypothetical protein AAFV19_06210 [Pseudomonadota bacterium]
MTRTIAFTRSTTPMAALLCAVLIALALLTPHVNASAPPPSSVFVSWPKAMAVPEVEVSAQRDSHGRWYLDLQAEGFAFSELCQTVSGPQAIGHAHVYLGEEKIAAAYAPRVWLDDLPPGRHRIRVVLRSQDHRALVGPGGLIAGEAVVTVRAD